jgi:predicted NAD-dependent protein-ADP-ribosyltransferase YbiA (DUF1768 family)
MDSDCENLKALKNINNSCYLDSAIVALFAVKNSYLDEVLLTKSLEKREGKFMICSLSNNADEDLKNRKDIQAELRKIVSYMRNETSEVKNYCTDLRRMLFSKCKQPDNDKTMKKVAPEKRMMDSSEFLDFFLSLFDINALVADIKYYFNGVLEKTERRNQSIMWGPFLITDRAKEYNVQDLLQIVTTNEVTADRVGTKTEIIQVYSTPVLIVRIERNDEEIGYIDTPVEAQEIITAYSGQQLELSAIVCHEKLHYICYVKCGEVWYMYDDRKRTMFSVVGDYETLLTQEKFSPEKTGTMYFYKAVTEVGEYTGSVAAVEPTLEPTLEDSDVVASTSTGVDFSFPESRKEGDVLLIYSPSSIPFGWLSNNYKQDDLVIDRKYWNSPTNYIYSSMLKSPISDYTNNSYITSLKLYGSQGKRSIGDVVPLYYEYQKDIDDMIRKRAFIKANDVKFKDDALLKKLLNTGNRPIYYISEDPVFGVQLRSEGESTGENFVGESLERLRTRKRIEEEIRTKELNEDEIYKTYVSYELLRKQIVENKDDLTSYQNLSTDEVMKLIGGKANLSKTEIIKELKEGKLDPIILEAVKDPSILVKQLRKTYLRQLSGTLQKDEKDFVFDLYLNYLLKENFPDIEESQYGIAKTQQMKKLTVEEIAGKKDNLYEMYKSGTLPDEIQNMLESKIKKIDEASVMEAERYLIPVKDLNTSTSSLVDEPLTDAILISAESEYADFSPTYEFPITVDLLKYPSVEMYILTQLIYSINVKESHKSPVRIAKMITYSYADAYKNIVSDSGGYKTIGEVRDEYEKQNFILTRDRLDSFAKHSLDAKFSVSNYQDILLSTGVKNLVWNDRNDFFLGVKEEMGQKGENFVGRYMEEIRNYLARNPDMSPEVNEANLSVLLEDDFIRDWIKMRIQDMVYVTLQVKNATFPDVDVAKSRDFINKVLNSLYPPCEIVQDASVMMAPSEYIYTLLRRFKDFKTVDKLKTDAEDNIKVEDSATNVVLEFSNYIMNILKFIVVKLDKKTVREVKQTIIDSELQLSDGKFPSEDCIYSAIVNILYRIKSINPVRTLKKSDVDVAINIILGSQGRKGSIESGVRSDLMEIPMEIPMDIPIPMTESAIGESESDISMSGMNAEEESVGSQDMEMDFSDSDTVGNNIFSEDSSIVEYYTPEQEIRKVGNKQHKFVGNNLIEFYDEENEDRDGYEDYGGIRFADLYTAILGIDSTADTEGIVSIFKKAVSRIRNVKDKTVIVNRVNFFSDC